MREIRTERKPVGLNQIWTKEYGLARAGVMETLPGTLHRCELMTRDSPQTALVRRFYDEMWNKADKRHIPEIFHPDFTFRGSLGPVLVGHEQFAGYVDDVTRALPDFVCKILEMTEEDDRVVAKMLFYGRHRGDMFGYSPTGTEK